MNEENNEQTEQLVEQEQEVTEKIEEIGEQEFETKTIDELEEEVSDDPNSMFPDMKEMFNFNI